MGRCWGDWAKAWGGAAAILGLIVAAVFAIVTMERCTAGDPPPRHGQPEVVMEVMDESLTWCSEYWRAEIDRRFDNAVGVLVHGGELVAGQWVVGTSLAKHRLLMPVEDLVDWARQKHPDRTIVLLACNPGGLTIHRRNVYYFPANVWCIPDRAITPAMMQTSQVRKTLGGIDDEPQYAGGAPTTRHAAEQKSRWQENPTVCGNIYEAIRAW